MIARELFDLDRGAFDRATAAVAGTVVAKTSTKVGVSREALQEWQHAAEMSGVGSDEFEHGLCHLALTAYNAANGSGEAVLAFRQLVSESPRAWSRSSAGRVVGGDPQKVATLLGIELPENGEKR